MFSNKLFPVKTRILVFTMLLAALQTVAQPATQPAAPKAARVTPTWWFGESVAANFNNYRGTTQTLNGQVKAPTAFHAGDGVKPYVSLLAEYRPGKVWGGMLNIAFDNRGGSFDAVLAPCNCPADLKTNLSYITVEPSIRVAPFSNAFYLFAGPTFAFNISRSFVYAQDKQTVKRGEWSDIRRTLISAQAGAGIDIPVSKPYSTTQMTVSPFASFQTDLGQAPRTIESWSMYTVRTGIALKFGTGTSTKKKTDVADVADAVAVAPAGDVVFSVRGPKVVPEERQVKETFPLLSSVFFDKGSSSIPSRYIQLNSGQASAFREEQLQQGQPANLNNGRSARQMAVYHQVLNVMGDRLRRAPGSTIALSGASDNNPADGKVMAEAVKQYLVSAFGIDPSRISTAGTDKPLVPSEQPGATRELDLLKEGDRRVDMVSTSPDIMIQVGGKTSPYLKPVQFTAVQSDPLDSHVIFTNTGAATTLNSWLVELTDDRGAAQRFGPYTTDKASVPGKSILGNLSQGNYKVKMIGQAKDGRTIVKESSVSLVRGSGALQQQGLRYSILFDFDKAKSVDSYEQFLDAIVAPLIAAGNTVIIHGHTDIIGEEGYNRVLSEERARGTRTILERSLRNRGISNVRFETFGYGEDTGMAPFENGLPEERFYNRSVIIDIVSEK